MADLSPIVSKKETQSDPSQKKMDEATGKKHLLIVGLVFLGAFLLTLGTVIAGILLTPTAAEPRVAVDNRAGYYDREHRLIEGLSIEVSPLEGTNIADIKGVEPPVTEADTMVLPRYYQTDVSSPVYYLTQISNQERGSNIFGKTQSSSTITQIVFSSYIQDIGTWSFSGLCSLKEVKGPFADGLSLLDHCFEGCSSLSNFSFPVGLESIGERAFAETAFTEIDLSETSLKSIGTGAFADCSSLESVALPASLETLGSGFLSGSSCQTVDYQGTVEEFSLLDGSAGAFSGSNVTVVHCLDGDFSIAS